jgi:NAD(P)-dependent dehydrogenase (short-subunit alcohol dehydrogenase family)
MTYQKIALVTGANKGIGFEVAKQLSERGFIVYLTARRQEAGKQAAASLQNDGTRVTFVPLDVSDEMSIKKAAREVAETASHVDVLVNNAGIYPDGESTILNVDQVLLEKSYVTNTLGPLRVAQAFWPLLAKSKAGRIINVSSGLGSLSEMAAMAPSYSLSKAALNAVTRQLAAALKDKNISVNSVCPGWVRTDAGGPNAQRSVEEGAEGIVWLAAEAPDGLTGRFLRDGKEIPW